MNSFWKNEWDVFCNEVDSTLRFLTQPISLFASKEDKLKLKPTSEEVSQKRDASSFWKNEWDMFCDEVDSSLDYITKPMNIK